MNRTTNEAICTTCAITIILCMVSLVALVVFNNNGYEFDEQANDIQKLRLKIIDTYLDSITNDNS